jgi:N-acetylglucosaminyldiphosphoundecaprenol N-acetyl-beta-D-mannosaminyltransferase
MAEDDLKPNDLGRGQSGMQTLKNVPFLGIDLAALTIHEAVDHAVTQGGLICAPSGPGLCDLASDDFYVEALNNADLNLPDSGLAILLLRLLKIGRLPRTSGLGFLTALLHRPELQQVGASLWVMPTQSAADRNMNYLRGVGVQVEQQSCYVAPMYPKNGPVCDESLRRILSEQKPPFVFICTGSGSQEKLGFWLKQSLGYRPAICCIGAAIAFLSGEQAKVSPLADKLCLGWFVRCLHDPKRFIPRYLRAFKLVGLVLKYRDKSPVVS